jgi:glutamine synthetase
VVLYLKKMQIAAETDHHEVAPGQYEIDIHYADALTTADNTITLKHTIQRTAYHQGLKATFIPKLFFEINGSGMHTHQSLFNLKGENLFYDKKDSYHFSSLAYHFIAGQMKHARALSALCAPTVVSYKRLVPGYEAPVYICFAQINRAALIRIPRYTPGREKSTRCEFRSPDPLANPYLAFAVMLAAGLDGIEKKMIPPPPVEEDVYHFDDQKLKQLNIQTLPGSLKEAVEELKKDQVLLSALGSHCAQKFIELKEKEWEQYLSHYRQDLKDQVTQWEIEKYL